MDTTKMLTELQNSHYNIYNEALTNKKELSTLDSTLVFLSSNAFYELDSLVLLTNNNKIHGTYSLCRTILEKLIYMKYILEENSLNRAKDFQLANFKLSLNIYEKAKALYPDLKSIYPQEEVKEMEVQYKNKKFYASKDKYKWYGVKGKNTISGLFSYYNENEFGYYYMKYSGEVHSNDTISKFLETGGNIQPKAQQDNTEVIYVAIKTFCNILNLLVKHYDLSDRFTSFNISTEFTIKI